MESVTVRKLKIGEGIPKICVPVVGVTMGEIIEETKKLIKVPADMAEWRADWYENVFDFENVKIVLKEIRNILKDMPILFTFRTAKEGGEKAIDKETYLALNKAVSESPDVDLIDVELFLGDSLVEGLVAYAHTHNTKVIVSNHDFHKTPMQNEIVERLRKMQKLGADVSKIAVMPQKEEDVQVLLDATREMSSRYAVRPIVTMSMTEMGVASRIEGERYGSAITFGTAGNSSAPGQMQAGDLKNELKRIHAENKKAI